MHIKTMAVKITEKTYPVAVACLPGNFILIPLRSVLGYYLVINEIGVLDREELSKSIALTNTWYSPEDFRDSYEFVDGELKTNFAEVRHL